MKKLIYILVIVAICLVAMIAAPSLVGDKGYVMIQMGNLVVETSVVALGIMVFIGLVGWIILATLFSRTWRLTKLSGSWFGNRSRRKTQKAFCVLRRERLPNQLPDSLVNRQVRLSKVEIMIQPTRPINIMIPRATTLVSTTRLPI